MKQLPAPDSYQEYSNYSYSYVQVAPYSSLEWTDLVAKLGVQVPEVVDRTCGKSKCRGCGAVYVGTQSKCTAKVVFYKAPGSWHGARAYSYNCSYEEKECESYLDWDLQKEFNDQVEFFRLLERVNRLPDLNYEPLVKFREAFAPGVADVLQIRLLSSDLEGIKAQLPMITDAIKTIAQKMSAAGNALSFNL